MSKSFLCVQDFCSCTAFVNFLETSCYSWKPPGNGLNFTSLETVLHTKSFLGNCLVHCTFPNSVQLGNLVLFGCVPVCLLVIMSAPHSEWHMHACHVEDCTTFSDVYHYREYYGDSANRQCQLCHPLCDRGCTGEMWVLYLCPLCSALFHSGLFVQGPSNCTMCTSSSLYVNRSNVIECVNRTCPV